MMVDNTLDQYAVFGNPVAHSKSPQIHAEFARQTDQSMVYSKQLVPEGQFEQAANAFFEGSGKGLNITVPFKLDAYSYAARLTPRARRAGAVNTLALQEDGTVLGDTTDGVGMVSDILENLGWQIRNKRVLILGAGGAVRGVLEPLLEQAPKQLVIANRTLAKALQLVKGFKDLARPKKDQVPKDQVPKDQLPKDQLPEDQQSESQMQDVKLQACGFADLAGLQFDLIINGTSASLSGDLPPLPGGILAEGGCCYDMMYGAEPTVFLQWATSEGAEESADGMGMLVCQAAESFNIWRGVRPETQPVIDKMRTLLT